MSYSYNYKALWLYYKIKDFTIVKLSCSVVNWSNDYRNNTSVLGWLETEDYVLNYTHLLK